MVVLQTNQYIEVFLEESREHLQAINDHLLNFEKNPEDKSIVNEMFRSAHTLKGMAATMGFESISNLTHKMENVFDQLREGEIEIIDDVEVIDLLLEVTEVIEEMVDQISRGEDGKKDVSHLITRLEQISEIRANQPKKTIGDGHTTVMDLDEYQSTIVSLSSEQGYRAYHVTVKLSETCVLKFARVYMVFDALEDMGEVIKSIPPVEDLEEERFEWDFSVAYISKEQDEVIEERLLKVAEVETVQITALTVENAKNTIKPEQKGKADVSATRKSNAFSNTLRVNSERVDRLMNLFEELVIDRGRLEDVSLRINDNELMETVENISRISREMQSMLLTIRMVPIEHVFNRFPRMVRGMAKELNKQIALEMNGIDTEIDRSVIDVIVDPLVHLIRNSIDHGIETPDVRKKHGKQPEGKIILQAYQIGNNICIEIKDDGAGINREKVVKKAIEKELLNKEQVAAMSEEEINSIIFMPGFSTADQVSDLSGRGVGLDVVKTKIQSLRGSITVESKIGEGSTFSIQLPLTLSILSTLLVQVDQEIYAIPLASVSETILLKAEQMMNAHGKKVIDYRGKVIPLVFLKDVYKQSQQKNKVTQNEYAIVVIQDGEKMLGLVVDTFLGQREVVLKSLGDYLKNIFAISGATILGNGKVALIVDPNALLH